MTPDKIPAADPKPEPRWRRQAREHFARRAQEDEERSAWTWRTTWHGPKPGEKPKENPR